MDSSTVPYITSCDSVHDMFGYTLGCSAVIWGSGEAGVGGGGVGVITLGID